MSVRNHLRANATGCLATLMKPTTARSNTALRKILSDAYGCKLVHQTISNAAPVASPLQASVFQAAVGKAKPFFRSAPFVGDFHELLVNDDSIGREGDRAIRENDPEQSRSRAAAGTRAE